MTKNEMMDGLDIDDLDKSSTMCQSLEHEKSGGSRSHKKKVIILGMRRSGTSLVAELVARWGAFSGDEKQLMPGNEWNQRGYWEYLPLVNFNEELLASVSADWTTPPVDEEALSKKASQPRYRARATGLISMMQERSDIWLWKDPQLAILLPFWERIWQDAIYVIAVRHPLDVARSLEKRDQFSISSSLILWQYYNLCILRHTENNQSKIFLQYEQLIQEPGQQCQRLVDFLDTECGIAERSHAGIEAISQAVDSSLRHNKNDTPLSAPHQLSTEQKAVYEALGQKIKYPQSTFEQARFISCQQWPYHLQSLLRFQRGSDLVKEGKLADGLDVLSRLLELSPNHSPTLELIGDLCHGIGKTPRAKQMWEMALSLQPANAQLLRKLAKPKPVDLRGLKNLGKFVDCSIIIPVLNQLHFTQRCLGFIEKNTPDGCYEVIVVDNHSADGTAEFLQSLEGVKVIRNPSNWGFSRACNQGAQEASHEFLLFLNNDVEVQQGWLTPLVLTLLGDSDVAVVGSKLLYPDGRIQHAGVVTVDQKEENTPMVPHHVYYRLPGTLPEANIAREYSVVTAACLLTRKSVFESVGGFDPRYRNGYEDVDYCYKVGAAGFKVVYRPESVAIHYESQSGAERFVYETTNLKKLIYRWQGRVPLDIRKLKGGKIEFLRPFKSYQIPQEIA